MHGVIASRRPVTTRPGVEHALHPVVFSLPFRIRKVWQRRKCAVKNGMLTISHATVSVSAVYIPRRWAPGPRAQESKHKMPPAPEWSPSSFVHGVGLDHSRWSLRIKAGLLLSCGVLPDLSLADPFSLRPKVGIHLTLLVVLKT